MPDKNIINLDEALEQLGDFDFYLELLDEFIAGLSEKEEQITQALTSGIDNDIRMISHSIKGVSANLHLPAIQHAAMVLENAAKDEKSGELPALSKLLISEFKQLVHERSSVVQE